MYILFNSLHRIYAMHSILFTLNNNGRFTWCMKKKIYHDISTIHISLQNIIISFLMMLYFAERLCKINEYIED